MTGPPANDPKNRRLLTITLAIAAAVVVATTGAAAVLGAEQPAADQRQDDARIAVKDDTPGAMTMHEFTFATTNLDPNGTEIDSVVIEYSGTRTDLNQVTKENLSFSDNTGHSWDGSDVESITTSQFGTAMRITMTKNASFSINSEERVFLTYGPVENSMEPGQYNVTVKLIDNGVVADQDSATFTIGDAQMGTTTAANGTTSATETTMSTTEQPTTEQPTTSEQPTTEPGTTEMMGGTTSAAGGEEQDQQPGFTVVLAVGVLFALAMVAARRSQG